MRKPQQKYRVEACLTTLPIALRLAGLLLSKGGSFASVASVRR